MRSFLIGSLLALSQAQTIVQIAQADPELRFLVDALVAGGLVETLNGCVPAACGLSRERAHLLCRACPSILCLVGNAW